MKQVGGIPPRGGAHAVTDWSRLADALRESPGEPVLIDAFRDTENVVSLAASINRTDGTVRALALLGGTVRAQMRNTRAMTGRRRRGDLWVTWTPAVRP